MPSPEQQDVVEQIHGSGRQLVIALTGGGSGAIAALLKVPGASASVLEAVVPYSSTAMQQWLGGPVEQYCSESTARAMAMRAFERARELSDADPGSLIGVGATASLATNRPKRGAHRIHVASQSATTTTVCSCSFTNSHQTRPDEEEISALLILHVVANACDITVTPFSKSNSTQIECQTMRAPEAWSELLLGERDSIFVGPQPNQASPQVLFPGAFNPPHQGHDRMAEIAAERCGKPVTFELSITNVDKPPLDFIEITNRLEQLADRSAVLTRAPTFVEKSALAPGCVFVVGADTLERIADPRYYGNDPAQRDAAIARIAGRGCRFLVFGRTHENRFATTSNIEIPAALLQLCDEVPESEFRVDISSTALRSDTMGSRKSAEESEAEH
jgi:nicotinamide mononucleotide (NMN) deamidase PncC